MTDIAKIAEGLTPAMREALIGGHNRAAPGTQHALFNRKLLIAAPNAAGAKYPFRLIIGPRGLAVRAHLLEGGE